MGRRWKRIDSTFGLTGSLKPIPARNFFPSRFPGRNTGEEIGGLIVQNYRKMYLKMYYNLFNK